MKSLLERLILSRQRTYVTVSAAEPDWLAVVRQLEDDDDRREPTLRIDQREQSLSPSDSEPRPG